jgi:hypothetical protein
VNDLHGNCGKKGRQFLFDFFMGFRSLKKLLRNFLCVKPRVCWYPVEVGTLWLYVITSVGWSLVLNFKETDCSVPSVLLLVGTFHVIITTMWGLKADEPLILNNFQCASTLELIVFHAHFTHT